MTEINTMFATIAENAKVGMRIKFEEEKVSYKIMARSERYLICTKPFNARKTYLYTIVDLVEGVRGMENLIFGSSFGTVKECEEALDRLEGRSIYELPKTEVSRRNRGPLRIEKLKGNSHD